MNKRTLPIRIIAVAVMLGLQSNIRADFVAKASTVHTSTAGATTRTEVNLISGNTSLGALFVNNVTTNSFPFAGVGNAVAVGSNLLSSYTLRTGGGTGAV